jgi:TolB-like protein/Flp pilus assembly protein TadD
LAAFAYPCYAGVENPRSFVRICFGDFELNVTGCELTKLGRPVLLEHRPTEILCHLASRPNTLVTREILAREIWGAASAVDADMGINTAIRKIRAVLGDTPAAPRHIETVQGRGYRFIAPIQPEAISDLPVSTIAVLPFDNLTGSEAQSYIAEGFTEEMISALGLVEPERIQVIGRRSVMMLRDKTLALADVGARLGAGHLLESAIRAEGRYLRATTKLIHAPSEQQVWTAAYNGPRDGLLAFQQEVSLAVCDQIRGRFAPDAAPRVLSRHTSSEAAFDLYLRGRSCWNRNVSSMNQEALGYFARATELDPGYALAWSGLADTYSASPINSDVPAPAVWRQAREAAEKAVLAGPDLAEAHASIGFVRFWLDWDWHAAEQDFRRAIALDPNYAFAHRMLGIALSHLGSDIQAAAAMRRSVALDPLFAMHRALSAMVAFQAGAFAQAAAFGREATALDPGFWIGHYQLAQALEQIGKAEEALDVLSEAARVCGNSSKPLMLQGYILARAGKTEAAQAPLALLRDMAADRFVPPYSTALIHAGLGDADAAFAALENSLAVRDVNLVLLPRDPKWKALPADPRFDDIVRRCGFTGPPPAHLPLAEAVCSLQTVFSSSPWRQVRAKT